MSIAYFDCFAGAAGDMIVGALLDAGADFAKLQAQLAGLKVGGFTLRAERVMRRGIAGTKFHVDLDEHDHAHRHLSDILAMIDAAGLPARAADRAKRIFTRLGAAEAKVHNLPIEQIHFHEVGALDSIADIVGACVAMELLDIERIYCSAIPTGSGTIQCAHGLLPVPPPATAELLRGVKIAPTDLEGELTTPTAAAILTTLAESYGPMPAIEVTAVGYGAGTRDGGPVANLLRVFVGRPGDTGTADTAVELSANLDDCTGEIIGSTIEKLLSAGCLDAWATPAVMKKSRPAWVLSALCSEHDVAAAEEIIFSETTTFGIRRRACSRSKLLRRFATVQTVYGPVRVKIGEIAGTVVTAAPEFADCRATAEAHHVSVREVMSAAMAEYRQGGAP